MRSVLYGTEVKRVVTLDQRLSKQEKKCLFLAYKGKNIKETAVILKISQETVEEYRATLRKKIQAKTMQQAIGLGIKYQYIVPDC
jgi:DNA-binding CsgD family transcriptional regulator